MLRVRLRLSSSTLPENTLFVLCQERPDLAERQADALATKRVLSLRLRAGWTLVRTDRVHPLRVCLQSQSEHGIMRKGYTLALARSVGHVFAARARGFELVLLTTQRHHTLCTKTDIYDLRPAYDVDCLIGMFRDVIRSGAVVLYQDVVYWVTVSLLNVFPDRSDS